MTRLRKLVAQILKHLGFRKGILSVAILDDAGIRPMNRRYLKHDRATDVMAFGYAGCDPFGVLGDIAISAETVRRQAVRYGHSFFYELVFCLCHGILHLSGMEDRTVRGKRGMDRRQTAILKSIGVTPLFFKNNKNKKGV
jgi:probable rRNA maturation factor